MKKIKLNKNELLYLTSSLFLNVKYLDLIKSSEKRGDDYFLLICEDEANLLRDQFSEQLQFIGFDENYKLTKDGKILEDLIDKFFCD